MHAQVEHLIKMNHLKTLKDKKKSFMDENDPLFE